MTETVVLGGVRETVLVLVQVLVSVLVQVLVLVPVLALVLVLVLALVLVLTLVVKVLVLLHSGWTSELVQQAAPQLILVPLALQQHLPQ